MNHFVLVLLASVALIHQSIANDIPCNSTDDLTESAIKAWSDLNSVSDFGDWVPDNYIQDFNASISLAPEQLQSSLQTVLTAASRYNQCASYLKQNATLSIKAVSKKVILNDAKILEVISDNKDAFADVFVLSGICELIEKSQIIANTYVKDGYDATLQLKNILLENLDNFVDKLNAFTNIDYEEELDNDEITDYISQLEDFALTTENDVDLFLDYIDFGAFLFADTIKFRAFMVEEKFKKMYADAKAIVLQNKSETEST